MSNIWKAVQLDFALIKSYIGTVVKMMIFPVFTVLINRSLYFGITFAITFISITACYPFSIAEKNSLERLYGILPVRKSSLVIGRYAFCTLLGLAALVFALISQSFVLRMVGETIRMIDVAATFSFGIFLLTLFTVFQLPGYYKYGTIKGRMFMYVPIVGLSVVAFLFAKLPFSVTESLGHMIGASPALLALLMTGAIVAMYTISIWLSVRIFYDKEM